MWSVQAVGLLDMTATFAVAHMPVGQQHQIVILMLSSHVLHSLNKCFSHGWKQAWLVCSSLFALLMWSGCRGVVRYGSITLLLRRESSSSRFRLQCASTCAMNTADGQTARMQAVCGNILAISLFCHVLPPPSTVWMCLQHTGSSHGSGWQRAVVGGWPWFFLYKAHRVMCQGRPVNFQAESATAMC